MTARANTSNRLVRCPRCTTLITMAYKSLRWIRCPECGKAVTVKENLLPEWLMTRRL